ncbi:MAG: PTS sugar transporter subunit IIB [Anaerorhabdus sp.]
MGTMHYRIDDRLIHGIVAGYWTNHLKATRIMVIDEKAANDEIVRTSLRMACPKNVNLSVLTPEKAITNIKAGNYESQNVFVISKTPEVFDKLQQSGILVDQVNMGNITYTNDRIKVAKTVSVNTKEIEALEHLSSNGTKIISQLIPEDTIDNFMDLLANAKKQ